MKTIVKFEALVKTRVRNANGKKVTMAKGKTFKTTEEYAETYRGYKRLFKEISIEQVEEKTDKVQPKGNGDAFPVTISEDMPNKEIEKLLSEMGAKFKKNGSKKELLKAYEEKQNVIAEEKRVENEEKQTEIFKKMIDNRTIDQLEELVNDMEKALDVEAKINKEVCEEYILEVLEKKMEEKTNKGKEDNDGNSEGSLDGADAGEGANGSDEGNDTSNGDAK